MLGQSELGRWALQLFRCFCSWGGAGELDAERLLRALVFHRAPVWLPASSSVLLSSTYKNFMPQPEGKSAARLNTHQAPCFRDTYNPCFFSSRTRRGPSLFPGAGLWWWHFLFSGLFTGRVRSGRVKQGWRDPIRESLKPPDATRPDPTRPVIIRKFLTRLVGWVLTRQEP